MGENSLSSNIIQCLDKATVNTGGNLQIYIPYFFGYKTEFFSFQNNPKDLDSSCKTDLDLWDCLGRVKLYYSKIS